MPWTLSYNLSRWVIPQVLVISRLDYCNSLLAGRPAKAIRPLQLVVAGGGAEAQLQRG